MRSRWLQWGLLTAIGLGLGCWGDRVAWSDPAQGIFLGFRWWVAAILVLGVAAVRLPSDSTATRLPWSARDTLALIVVFVVSAAFRLWRIGEYPPPARFGFEELQAGGLAYRWMLGQCYPLEFPLTNFLPSLSFRLFGLSGPALRLPFVLSGIIAPPLLFLALRRIVTWPAAFAAALLLAVCRWAAVCARFSDESFLPISLVAGGAWLAIVVVQTRRGWAAWALGILCGMLFYEYTGYRGYPLVGLMVAGLGCLRGLKRHTLSGVAIGCFITLLAAWFVWIGAGAVQTIAGHGGVFIEALQRHSVNSAEMAQAEGVSSGLALQVARLGERLREGLGLFLFQGDAVAWYNIPNDPLYDPVSAILCFGAVLWVVIRRPPWGWSAVTLFVIPFFLASLIPTNFAPQRYFVFVVPMFALVAFVFDDLLRLRRAGTVAVVVLVAICAFLNARKLQALIDDKAIYIAFLDAENEVLESIGDMPRGARAVLISREASNAFEPSDYNWLSQRVSGKRPHSVTEALTVNVEPDQPVYWIVQGDLEVDALSRLVESVCPANPLVRKPSMGPWETVGYVSTPSSLACKPPNGLGLKARYVITRADGSEEVREQFDAILAAFTIDWAVGGKLDTGDFKNLTVEWSGRIQFPKPGKYVVGLEPWGAAAHARIGDVDLTSVAEPGLWKNAEVSVDVGEAALPIKLSLQAKQYPRIRLTWHAEGEPRALIPAQALLPE